MVRQTMWIGITIAAFFVGIGASYAIFSATDDPNTMKFANQELFDQMMSNNPKMTSQWIESTMQDPQSNQQKMEQMNEMMNDPKLRKQMMYYMMQNQEFMQDMMQNNQMMDMMKNRSGSFLK